LTLHFDANKAAQSAPVRTSVQNGSVSGT